MEVHKAHLWRRASARIYADLRDQQIPDNAKVFLEQAHAALNAAADAVQVKRNLRATGSEADSLRAQLRAVVINAVESRVL
jgi:hypothetical protein